MVTMVQKTKIVLLQYFLSHISRPLHKGELLHYIPLSQLILALHLLISPVFTWEPVPSAAPPYFQWVTAPHEALLRSPILINAARTLVEGI